VLVVVAGLPGTGKTTLGRAVSDLLDATFLRIDSIETAIARCGLAVADSPVGYAVGAAIAADQLRAGRTVVVDAVSPITEARNGWVALAAATGAVLRLVEVTCSDRGEHRRRVERRTLDGQSAPTWQQVLDRRYDAWTDPHLVVDNIGDPEPHIAEILVYVRDGELV
jgi:predicted kinase